MLVMLAMSATVFVTTALLWLVLRVLISKKERLEYLEHQGDSNGKGNDQISVKSTSFGHEDTTNPRSEGPQSIGVPLVIPNDVGMKEEYVNGYRVA